MAKMVKSAQGLEVDWDLLKLRSEVSNNVADVVEVVDQAAVAARRQQRARMDAAKKLLEKAQQEIATPAVEQPTKKAKSNA
jgi:hypothetical protein